MADPAFADFLAAEAQGEQLRSAFAGFFETYDVLLTPIR
jgi:aspartyl-tRNA(Asn)/glutamyl-tRNA(Gln) amidotransferase subunit A